MSRQSELLSPQLGFQLIDKSPVSKKISKLKENQSGQTACWHCVSNTVSFISGEKDEAGRGIRERYVDASQSV